jgi:hypothetical protein
LPSHCLTSPRQSITLHIRSCLCPCLAKQSVTTPPLCETNRSYAFSRLYQTPLCPCHKLLLIASPSRCTSDLHGAAPLPLDADLNIAYHSRGETLLNPTAALLLASRHFPGRTPPLPALPALSHALHSPGNTTPIRSQPPPLEADRHDAIAQLHPHFGTRHSQRSTLRTRTKLRLAIALRSCRLVSSPCPHYALGCQSMPAHRPTSAISTSPFHRSTVKNRSNPPPSACTGTSHTPRCCATARSPGNTHSPAGPAAHPP